MSTTPTSYHTLRLETRAMGCQWAVIDDAAAKQADEEEGHARKHGTDDECFAGTAAEPDEGGDEGDEAFRAADSATEGKILIDWTRRP